MYCGTRGPVLGRIEMYCATRGPVWEEVQKELSRNPAICPNYAQIGDGICQDKNNKDVCFYDGGDCCLEELDTTQCNECKCFSKDEFDPCPDGHKIGDGVCDLSNNKTVCSFDGGDCSR